MDVSLRDKKAILNDSPEELKCCWCLNHIKDLYFISLNNASAKRVTKESVKIKDGRFYHSECFDNKMNSPMPKLVISPLNIWDGHHPFSYET